MANTYSIAFPGNPIERSWACQKCEEVEQEYVEAVVAFEVAYRCLQEGGRVSRLDEFLCLHQAVLRQQQRLDLARIALNDHLERHGKLAGAQAIM
jgi:hypothetical protein